MNNLIDWINYIKGNLSSCTIYPITMALDATELIIIAKEFRIVSKKLLKQSKDVKLNKETRLVLKKLAKWEKYGASNE